MKPIQLLIIPLFLSLFLLTGCAQKGPTGTWQQSREAKALFESATVLENHTYYYTGPKARPDAIIAVDNRYRLQSRLWVQTDVSSSTISEWLSWYKSDLDFRCMRRGGYIITPDNQRAGIWYSRYVLSVIRSPEPGVLEIYPPYPSPGSACDKERFRDER